MMLIGVRANIDEMLSAASALEREQMPFATALALTRTAQYAKAELVSLMDVVFDRPTPFTKGALYIVPATKQRLTATVKVKDEAAKGNPAVRWLMPEIFGGTRNMKGFEALLMRNGLLPRGWYAVPAIGAPLDGYGNVPGNVITKILSQLQASRDSTANESADVRRRRNRRQQQGRYFAVIPGRAPRNKLPPGIYERFGTTQHAKVVPVFVFTSKAPHYQKRYDFYGVGERIARERFPTEFRAAMKVALESARNKNVHSTD